MSDKLGRAVNVLTALAGLALAARLAPVAALVAVLAGLGWLLGKGRGAGLVLASSLVLGLGPGLGTHLLQGIPHFSLTGHWMPRPPVPPLVFRAWLGTAKLSNPANQVGRLGLVAGAVLGLVLGAVRRREGEPHGRGRVQGRHLVRPADWPPVWMSLMNRGRREW